MDRFIGGKGLVFTAVYLFKIQYGQIYRAPKRGGGSAVENLKSSMDRFIGTLMKMANLLFVI